MPYKFFLSHDSRDRALAETISTLIRRVTLGQISFWYSSDLSPSGGLVPGHVWLDKIRSELVDCRAIVVLLTPSSISRPWLLFEAGFGSATPNCDVVPVCVGIDSLSDVPFPLGMYQAFQLVDYESLTRFVEKLTSKYEIQFDERMARPYLREAVRNLSQTKSPSVAHRHKPKEPSLTEAIAAINEHVDKRIVSLMSSTQPQDIQVGSGPAFSIAIDINPRRKTSPTQYVEISPDMTVQDVLDHVYFMLDGEVQPYKYLEQWLLRDQSTKTQLVIREVQSMIPAAAVFSAGSKWEVIRLRQPYNAGKKSTRE